MRRRDFVAVLAGSIACAFGERAVAQSERKLPLLGVLVPYANVPGSANMTAFADGLRMEGLSDGKTVRIMLRAAENDFARLPALAAELVAAQVDIIVTASTPGVLAAEGATRTTPIVFAAVGDPIALGVAKALAHPGGNATGITLLTEELNAKRLALVKEALPAASRVALLVNPSNPGLMPIATRDVPMAARALGIEVRSFDVARVTEFDAVMAAAVAWKADAVMSLDDPLFSQEPAPLAAAALRHSLPMIGSTAEMGEAGCLFAYGIDIADNWRHAAVFVAKILKGANPADIPIENPTRFVMIANLKTAKALAISLPTATLLRADRVIE
jgi:putative tryptophan/tyrosine transport system substrate-binding protein